ncbi:MAG: glycosyltransferase family 39 protein [bacterium]
MTTAVSGSSKRASAVLAAILVTCGALYLWGIDWGLPGTRNWAIDPTAPVGPVIRLGELWTGTAGESDNYVAFPYMHYFVLAVVHLPYLAFLFLTGGWRPEAGWPWGFANPVRDYTVLMVMARVVSAAMGVGVVWLVWKTARELYDETCAHAAALAAGLSAAIVFHAHTSKVDLPYVFWCVLALWLWVKAARGASLRLGVLAGCAAAAAVATKDQAAWFFVGFPVALWFNWGRSLPNEEGGASDWRPRVRALAWFAVAAGVTYVVVNVLPSLGRLENHLVFLLATKLRRAFPLSLTGAAAFAWRTGRLLWLSSVPLTVAGGAGLLWALARPQRRHLFWLLPLGVYAAVLFVLMGLVVQRWTMPLLVCLSFPAGLTVRAVLGVLRRPVLKGAAIALFVGPALAQAACMDLRLVRDTRYAAQAWLADHVRDGETVEVYSQSQVGYLPALPGGAEVEEVSRAEMTRAGLAARRPDWIVLTWFWYQRYHACPGERDYLEALCQGDADYHVAEVFELNVPPRPEDGGPYAAPRIVVLRRGGREGARRVSLWGS